MENPHIGGDFDDFLKEKGIREEVVAAAINRASMALGVPLAESEKMRFNEF